MAKKVIKVIERQNADELQAYFAAMPDGKPLDLHEERVLLEYFPEVGVKCYINRFRFSEKAEILFIDKAPAPIRLTYINYYGLRETTQRHIIDKNLIDAAQDFIRMRHFDDLDYLLAHGSPLLIGSYLREYSLPNDNLVLMLLRLENTSLFNAYVSRGHFISEDVIKVIIDERRTSAFNALVYTYFRRFKKKVKTMTYQQMRSNQVADVMLSGELQKLVMDTFDRWFIEPMLKTTPLVPEVQAMLFDRNYDVEWLKLHVSVLYCVGGYRFEPDYELRLFKLLASKNLDDCLTTFRHRDDVGFVSNASIPAAIKYIKEFWLTDDGQVAAIGRGNVELIKVLISRYSPEHGLCWQAEVKLVEVCSPEIIRLYTSFHTMCGEALSLLGRKSKPELDYYYSKHPY